MHKIFFSFALFTFHYLAPPLFAFLSLSFSHSLLMWRGHDLRLLRSQIAGMLATAERTGTNIPKGIRDPCCQQPCPSKWPRVQSANLSRCSKSTRLIGQMAQAIWHQLASLYKAGEKGSGGESISIRQTNR